MTIESMPLLDGVVVAPFPILAELQSHIAGHGATRTRRYRTNDFFTGSSLRLRNEVRHSACTSGRATPGSGSHRPFTINAVGDPTKSTFLSMEEAGLIEMTGLDMHEKFLARLTVSSLNLLRRISEQEGTPIEELNAGKICDWFLKDKAKKKRTSRKQLSNGILAHNGDIFNPSA